MSKKPNNEYLMRFYITIAAGVVGLIGVVLLIYASVDLSDIIQTSSPTAISEDKRTYESNSIVQEPGRVAGENTDTTDTIWDGLFSILGPIIRKKPLILIRNERISTIAYVNEDKTINPVYFIPGNSHLIQAFENNAITYIQKNPEGQTTLTLNTGSDKETYLLPLEKEFNVESIFLDPNQKIFYLVIENGDTKELVWYIPGAESYTKIIELVAFKDVELLIENYIENQIFLKSVNPEICYVMNIEARRLRETDCFPTGETHSTDDFIIQDNTLKLYRSNDEIIDLFPLDGQFIYENTFVYGNKIYYTTSQVANAAERALMEFDIETNEHKILVSSLKTARVNHLFRYGNTIFMIIRNSIYTFELNSEGETKNVRVIDLGIDQVDSINILNKTSKTYIIE